jgi:UDP-N-acetylmuramoyl-tripeptide--D-alanyl-D-alanine ligase
MLPLTLAEVALSCGGHLELGDQGGVIQSVTIDSRAVTQGDLFFGVRGEQFNGDDFAVEALRAGAAAVVVGEATARRLPAGAARIVVADGRVALGTLANAVRRRAGVTVAAITGSVGKTSTKDILAALLRPVARVVATRGNFNNEFGVPLTLLSVDRSTEVVVVELAMRGQGQIRELARIARPDVGVITNIAPVHLELVGSVEEVARAKAELIEELEEGSLVVPEGEPLLEPYLRVHHGRVVTFGRPGSRICAIDVEMRRGSTHALIDAFGRRARFDFNFSGGHLLDDALAAIGAFIELGYTLEQAKLGAGQIEFSGLRGEITQLTGGGVLLNDSYNANPVSMRAALDHLASIADGRPMVAILGEMHELGPGAAGFHRAVGEHAATTGVRLIAVGELARDFLVGAPGESWWATVEECIEALPRVIAPGTAIVVKASRALRLERVADVLLGRPVGTAPATARDTPTGDADAEDDRV